MAYAAVSKTVEGNLIRVQLPFSALINRARFKSGSIYYTFPLKNTQMLDFTTLYVNYK